MEEENSQLEINSLSDLHRRKEMLRLEMKITRQAIGAGVKNTEVTVKSNIIRKVLIPLGAGGLASILYDESQTDADKPSWLLFLQQMVNKINEYYEVPVQEDTSAQKEQQQTPS